MPRYGNHAILSFLNKVEDTRARNYGSINRIDLSCDQNSTIILHMLYGLIDSRTIEVLNPSDIKYGFTTYRTDDH